MIYTLFIFCIVILAFIYYASVVAQTLFPEHVIITKQEIHLLPAIIPFYYWIVGGDKDTKEKENN